MEYLVIWNINGEKGWKKASTKDDADILFDKLNNDLSSDDYIEIIDIRETYERPEYLHLKNTMREIAKLSEDWK